MAINDVKEPNIRQSLIQHFDRELSHVREEFQDGWTQDAEFHLQSAKVYLFALGFHSHSPEVSDDPVCHGRLSDTFRKLLLSGSTAAVRLIHIFSDMGKVGVESSTGDENRPGRHLMYYPKIYYARVCENRQST